MENFLGSGNPTPSAKCDKSGRRHRRIQNRRANIALLLSRTHVNPRARAHMPKNIYAFPAFACDCINHGAVTFLLRMHKASRHVPVFTFIDLGMHVSRGHLPSLYGALHSTIVYRWHPRSKNGKCENLHEHIPIYYI